MRLWMPDRTYIRVYGPRTQPPHQHFLDWGGRMLRFAYGEPPDHSHAHSYGPRTPDAANAS